MRRIRFRFGSGLQTSAAIAVAALCGAMQAVQTGVNLSLATEMVVDSSSSSSSSPNNPAAALVSFATGWALLLALSLAEQPFERLRAAVSAASSSASAPPSAPPCRRPDRWWHAGGGAIGTSVMLALMLATPRLGFALTSLARMLGMARRVSLGRFVRAFRPAMSRWYIATHAI